jgi:ribosomal protein L36
MERGFRFFSACVAVVGLTRKEQFDELKIVQRRGKVYVRCTLLLNFYRHDVYIYSRIFVELPVEAPPGPAGRKSLKLPYLLHHRKAGPTDLPP